MLHKASVSLLVSLKHFVHLSTAHLLLPDWFFILLHPVVTCCSLPHFLPTRVSTDGSNSLLLLVIKSPPVTFVIKAQAVWWSVADKEVRRMEVYPRHGSCDLKYRLALHLYFTSSLITHSFSRAQSWVIEDLVFPLHQTSPSLDGSERWINWVLFYLLAAW